MATASSSINKIEQQIKQCVQVLLDTSTVIRREWDLIETQKTKNVDDARRIAELEQANEVELLRLQAERKALEAMREQLETQQQDLAVQRANLRSEEKTTSATKSVPQSPRQSPKFQQQPLQPPPQPPQRIAATSTPLQNNNTNNQSQTKFNTGNSKPPSKSLPTSPGSTSGSSTPSTPPLQAHEQEQLTKLLEIIKPVFVDLLDLCNLIESNIEEARTQSRGLHEDVSLEMLQRLLAIRKNLEGTTRGISPAINDFLDNKFGAIARDFGNAVKQAISGQFEELVGRVKKLQRVPRQLLQLLKGAYSERSNGQTNGAVTNGAATGHINNNSGGNTINGESNGSGAHTPKTGRFNSDPITPPKPSDFEDRKVKTSTKKRRTETGKSGSLSSSANPLPTIQNQQLQQQQMQQQLEKQLQQISTNLEVNGDFGGEETSAIPPTTNKKFSVVQLPKQPPAKSPQPQTSVSNRRKIMSVDSGVKVGFVETASEISTPVVRASMPNGTLRPLPPSTSPPTGVNIHTPAENGASNNNNNSTWKCPSCQSNMKTAQPFCTICGLRNPTGTIPTAVSSPAISDHSIPAPTHAPPPPPNSASRPSLQKSISSPTAPRVVTRPPQQPQDNTTPSPGIPSPAPAGILPAVNPQQWRCHKCHSVNRQSDHSCSKCITPRPSVGSEGGTGTGAEWKCPSCTVLNKEHQPTCILCGTRAPEASPVPAGIPPIGGGRRESVSTPGGRTSVTKQPISPYGTAKNNTGNNNINNNNNHSNPNTKVAMSWKCPMCEVHNALTATHCDICATKRPAAI